MSSYKRIPRSLVKRSDETVTIAEDYTGNVPGYYQHVEENELQKVKEKVQQTEQVMLEELQQQRTEWVEQAYKEGFEKAKQQLKEEIYLEHEQLLKEARTIYEQANVYHQQLIQEAQTLKEQYVKEEQEQLLQVIVSCSEQLLRQKIEEAPEVLSQMFQSILQEITYENKKVFLRIHPKTREWLKEHHYALEDDRVVILPDGTLSPGDIVIETEREYIDATIVTQIETLKQVLRSAMYD